MAPHRHGRSSSSWTNRGVQIVDGNSVVRDMVVDGRLAFGLTDTDDACGALERDPDAPLKIVFPIRDRMSPVRSSYPIRSVWWRADPTQRPARRWSITFSVLKQSRRWLESGWFQVTLRDIGVVPPCADSSNIKTLQVGLGEIAEQIETAQGGDGRGVRPMNQLCSDRLPGPGRKN